VARLDNKKTLLECANTVLVLGILWSALAVCARRAFAALRCFGRADEVIE
jgi:hypothetical protein